MKLIIFMVAVAVAVQAAAPRDNLQQRVPLKLAHIAQAKQKDSQETFRVRDTNANVVAQISKVVLDEEGTRPRFVVLHVFDNVAQHRPLIVVPWETLSINTNTADVFIESDQNRLRQAPPVTGADVPNRAPSGWGKEHYTFYGVQPRDTPPEPEAAGAVALIGGTTRGANESSTRAAPVHRGSGLYILIAAFLIGFAVLMFARRSGRAGRAENV